MFSLFWEKVMEMLSWICSFDIGANGEYKNDICCCLPFTTIEVLPNYDYFHFWDPQKCEKVLIIKHQKCCIQYYVWETDLNSDYSLIFFPFNEFGLRTNFWAVLLNEPGESSLVPHVVCKDTGRPIQLLRKERTKEEASSSFHPFPLVFSLPHFSGAPPRAVMINVYAP